MDRDESPRSGSIEDDSSQAAESETRNSSVTSTENYVPVITEPSMSAFYNDVMRHLFDTYTYFLESVRLFLQMSEEIERFLFSRVSLFLRTEELNPEYSHLVTPMENDLDSLGVLSLVITRNSKRAMEFMENCLKTYYLLQELFPDGFTLPLTQSREQLVMRLLRYLMISLHTIKGILNEINLKTMLFYGISSRMISYIRENNL